jgi:4a-hydroxytetrahydrobiopterin dehydratase
MQKTSPITLADLLANNCTPKVDALLPEQIAPLQSVLPDWRVEGQTIVKIFSFKNYYQTLAFVNAIAYVIHVQDHHPQLIVTYNRCEVRYDTHSINNGQGGLSENDFICAAKVNAIYQQSHP